MPPRRPLPPETPKLAERIVWDLKRNHPGEEVAFLENEIGVLYAHAPRSLFSPSSAIVSLIQGVYENYPSQARAIVRGRIYSSHASSEMCRGMIKVAAKRATSEVRAIPHGLEIPVPPIDVSYGLRPLSDPGAEEILRRSPSPRTDLEFMRLAQALADTIPRAGEELHELSRPVASLLVSDQGAILAFGLNRNSRNRTLHAEVNLIQSHYLSTGRPIPSGTRIYTTLQSCRMCAGMMVSCMEDSRSVKVFYGETDPGPNARHTALQKLGIEEPILR